MELKKYLTISSLSAILLITSGCGLFRAKTVTEYVSVPVYTEVKPRPEKIELLPVYFYTVSDQNLNDFLEGNRFRYNGVVFIALEVKDYENLSYNTSELYRYIKEQQALLNYYEEQATPPEKSKCFLKSQIEEGRSLERTPAAQKGHNKNTIAICLHGLDKEKFTEEQFESLWLLCKEIDNSYEFITFHGHSEVSTKSCPVFNYTRVLNLNEIGQMI